MLLDLLGQHGFVSKAALEDYLTLDSFFFFFVSEYLLGNKKPTAFLCFLSIVNFFSEPTGSQWKLETLCNIYFNLK